MKVFVNVVIYKGIVDVVKVYISERKADREFKELCKTYNFDPEEMGQPQANEVLQWKTDLERGE